MKGQGKMKVYIMIKMIRQMQAYILVGTEVIINGANASVEENMRQLMKYDMADQMAHIFNPDKKSA